MAKDLQELLLHTIKDVYFAENAITKALPKMQKAAQGTDLKEAFAAHLDETNGQIERLERVFELLGERAEGVPCEAIKGILAEGDEIAQEFAGEPALDAGLIAAAQAVEHYEISRYGAMISWASQLGLDEVAELLNATLTEEKDTDALLTSLAENDANQAAEVSQLQVI